MAELYNITKWNIKPWIQTGGTREKCFIENPENGKLYYFKKSIDKYPAEFWSEIIASKLGKMLGFNVLDYNIAILNNVVGCLSESMIDLKNEELDHGINLIKKSVPNFKFTNRPIILFQDVEKSFLQYPGFILKFIDILLFDSIIGNQDRHSENWAIIRSLDVENINYNKQRIAKKAIEMYKKLGRPLSRMPFKQFFFQMMNDASLVNITFSPIYDSGSSLGREIPEELILDYINNENKMINYIKKGKSEIRWDSSKINHFELLKKIKKNYPDKVKRSENSVIEKFDLIKINQLIDNIDSNLGTKYQESKLSLHRKKMIIKFIELRISLLKETLD